MFQIKFKIEYVEGQETISQDQRSNSNFSQKSPAVPIKDAQVYFPVFLTILSIKDYIIRE